MADPERKIEKLLKEYAANRRREGGEPPPLHPAVRRSLQAEVNHHYGRKQTGFSILALFRPAWGWQLGAVAAALVVVGLVLFNRPSAPAKHEFFAKNEAPQAVAESSRAATTASAAAGPAPAEQPGPSTERKLALAPEVSLKPAPEPSQSVPQPTAARTYAAARDEAGSPSRKSEVALSSTNAAPAKDKEVALTPSLVENATRESTRYGLAGRATAAAPSSVAADTAAVLSAAEALQPAPTNALPTVAGTEFAMRPDSGPLQDLNAPPLTGTQLFKQLTPATARTRAVKSSSTLPVLASFRVEQSGTSLRIVDNDGSVYTGYVQPTLADNQNQAVTVQSANFRRAANVTDSLTAANQLQQNMTFRVLGTNRSLKQNVVFTGNIIGFDNSTLFSAASNAVPQVSNEAAKTQFKAPSTQQLLNNNQLLQNSTITGQAVVGGNNILRVQAVPTQAP